MTSIKPAKKILSFQAVGLKLFGKTKHKVLKTVVFWF